MSATTGQFREVSFEEIKRNATDDGRYRHLNILGHGAFGTVVKSEDTRANDRLVAIKMISTGSGAGALATLKMAFQEAGTLRQLRHPNIVGMEKVYTYNALSDLIICIVTEFCSGGSLTNYLSRRGELSGAEQMRFMRQIATGLKYLHSQGMTHRDIKPDNILLDADNNLKIADFGLAKAAWDAHVAISASSQTLGHYMTTGAGTPAFIAPEVYAQHYTNAADVFSTALVFVCIVCPKMFKQQFTSSSCVIPLASVAGSQDCLGRALHGTPSTRMKSGCSLLGVDRNISPPLLKLLDAMLRHSYHDRPTMSEVLEELQKIDSRPLPVTLDTAKDFESPKCC